MNCICCGSSLLFYLSPVNIWKCEKCQYRWSPAKFVNPYKTNKRMSQVYEERDHEDASKILSSLRLGLLYAAGVQSGRLLDVGCSVGSFLSLARRCGYQVSGCDVSPFVKDRFKNSVIHFLNTRFESLNGRINNLDAITMFDVLEHMKDPYKSLVKARTLLKPLGVLVISVPDATGIKDYRFPAWRHYKPSEHFHYFTRLALTELIRRCGFRQLFESNVESLIRYNPSRPSNNILSVVAERSS